MRSARRPVKAPISFESYKLKNGLSNSDRDPKRQHERYGTGEDLRDSKRQNERYGAGEERDSKRHNERYGGGDMRERRRDEEWASGAEDTTSTHNGHMEGSVSRRLSRDRHSDSRGKRSSHHHSPRDRDRDARASRQSSHAQSHRSGERDRHYHSNGKRGSQRHGSSSSDGHRSHSHSRRHARHRRSGSRRRSGRSEGSRRSEARTSRYVRERERERESNDEYFRSNDDQWYVADDRQKTREPDAINAEGGELAPGNIALFTSDEASSPVAEAEPSACMRSVDTYAKVLPEELHNEVVNTQLHETACELGKLRGKFVVLQEKHRELSVEHHRVTEQLRAREAESRESLRHATEQLAQRQNTVDQLRCELSRRHDSEVSPKQEETLAQREQRVRALETTLLHLEDERKSEAAERNERWEAREAEYAVLSRNLDQREKALLERENAADTMALAQEERTVWESTREERDALLLRESDMKEECAALLLRESDMKEECASLLLRESEMKEECAALLLRESEMKEECAALLLRESEMKDEWEGTKENILADFSRERQDYCRDAEQTIEELRSTLHSLSSTMSRPQMLSQSGDLLLKDLTQREAEVRRVLCVMAESLDIAPPRDTLSLAYALYRWTSHQGHKVDDDLHGRQKGEERVHDSQRSVLQAVQPCGSEDPSPASQPTRMHPPASQPTRMHPSPASQPTRMHPSPASQPTNGCGSEHPSPVSQPSVLGSAFEEEEAPRPPLQLFSHSASGSDAGNMFIPTLRQSNQTERTPLVQKSFHFAGKIPSTSPNGVQPASSSTHRSQLAGISASGRLVQALAPNRGEVRHESVSTASTTSTVDREGFSQVTLRHSLGVG